MRRTFDTLIGDLDLEFSSMSSKIQARVGFSSDGKGLESKDI